MPTVHGFSDFVPGLSQEIEVLDADIAQRNYTIEYQDEGVPVAAKGGIQYINFVGAGVTATEWAAGELEVNVPGGGTPADYNDFKAAMQFAQLTYFTEFTYTGDDLTNKSIYTDSGMGTQLFDVDYTYTLGDLTQIVATDVVNAITYTKDLAYSSGNLVSIEVT